MSLKFFGQYLLEQGAIDELQLRAALDLMEQENQTIGEIAIGEGFASAAECRRVHGEQRRKDQPWGELAVQMGVLNTVELEELLALQRRTRLPLAGALERLEALPADRLRALHDAFKSEYADMPETPSLPGSLGGNRVAEVATQLVIRLLRRVVGIDAHIGEGRELDAEPYGELFASVPILGLHGLQITMLAEKSFGEKLAVGLLGLDLADLAPELSLDAVGEFLNILAGNVVSVLEDEALELRLEPPCYATLPTSGWVFDLDTERYGTAQLVLEIPNSEASPRWVPEQCEALGG